MTRTKASRKQNEIRIFRNIGTLLTLAGVAEKDGRQVQEQDLGRIDKAAMVVENGRLTWVGPQKKLPKISAKKTTDIDLDGQTVLPGFVECHTHTIFSGSRAAEFEQRNRGVSYSEIAAGGGGILSTMQQTRNASASQLLQLGERRLRKFVEQGVTTVEMKTGYALDFENELKCLQVMKKLRGARVVSTYLGPHAVPPEFSSAEEYVKFCSEKVLPEICRKKLTDRVDIFVEKGFFSAAVARPYLQAAKEMGFSIAIHADQLSLSGGAELAVEYEATSADHLLQIGEREIQKLAKSKVTCVLLPLADLYMNCPYPLARSLIAAGARVALATDFNPGSSPSQDVSLVGLLARLQMKMTLPEVIAAYTYSAAAALSREKELGSLEVNKYADFFSTELDWTDLFYSAGGLMPTKVFSSGDEVL